MIEVLRPGFLTTIQDLGRCGFEHLGVSAAGVSDPLSARVANRLVGNPEGVPVIECTAYGVRVRFDRDARIAVCGGTFDCNVPMWRTVSIRSGFVLEIGRSLEGFRCYLAVGGGWNASRYLGSASVHVGSGFGRPLVRGDVLAIGLESPGRESKVTDIPCIGGLVRITLGPDAEEFGARDMFLLTSQEWRVMQDSSRQGIRLDGAERMAIGVGGDRLSEGVSLGAVQVFRDGRPAILFVDSQTTGGYPVIANVIGADQFQVAQLRPGAMVRFRAVGFAEARRALLEQEAWIQRVGG